MLAGARPGAVRVKLGAVVERDGVVGIRVAKDVPAVATVMAALKQGKNLVAGRGVAHGGVGVEFPVRARWQAFHPSELGRHRSQAVARLTVDGRASTDAIPTRAVI